jgi:hypothetical protein
MGYQHYNYDDSGDGSIMKDASDDTPATEAPQEVSSFLSEQ